MARTLVTTGLHTGASGSEQAAVIPGIAEGAHNGMNYPAFQIVGKQIPECGTGF